MNGVTRLYTAPLSVFAAAVCLATAGCDNGSSSADPGPALHALFEREWEWELSQDPLSAESLGEEMGLYKDEP
jgi:hypothetical protein